MNHLIHKGKEVYVTIDFGGQPTRYIAVVDDIIPRGKRVDQDTFNRYFKDESYSRESIDHCSDRLLIRKKLYLQMNGCDVYEDVDHRCSLPLIERDITAGRITVTALER